MYVDQNKIFIIVLSFIISTICWASGSQIKIVALSKNKIVIVDKSANRKILKVGDTTSNGLTLVSSTSTVAVFKDENGKLISMGINNDISSSYAYNKVEPDPNIEKININKDNQYLTTIKINNQDASAILDTGANFVTLNSTIAKKLNLSYKNDVNKINVATASSNKTEGYKIVIPSIKLGNIELNNIESIVIEGEHPPMVLIGMSFLKTLDLQYLGDHMEIKKRVPPKQDKPNSIASPPNTSPIANQPVSTKPTVPGSIK